MEGSILSDFIELSFRFERFLPRLIKFFLDRKLREYKEMGVLTDYDVTAKREGKHHFSFELDLIVNLKGR